ncbi:DUF4232 domain-containing protein [Streptomyces sp. NPDC015125]|uniref:DUF4232 domain-containing protein n=1 Tax=Streptomyces sp. NPDC015125 TaxID=3364938 RepID=UPI0036F77BEB
MPFTATACRAVAAGLLVTAALSLTTACHGAPGKGSDSSVTAVSPAPAPPFPDSGNPPPGPGGRVACTPEMLRFHAGALPRRDHRMLLTVTNFSRRTCDFAAQRYPLLRFGDGRQRALPVIGASRPLAVVSLSPNDTAYATITTSAAGGPGGTGHHGRKISQFGVALTAHAAPTQVGLDGRTPVRVDPHTARVTYWQTGLAAARKW